MLWWGWNANCVSGFGATLLLLAYSSTNTLRLDAVGASIRVTEGIVAEPYYWLDVAFRVTNESPHTIHLDECRPGIELNYALEVEVAEKTRRRWLNAYVPSCAGDIATASLVLEAGESRRFTVEVPLVLPAAPVLPYAAARGHLRLLLLQTIRTADARPRTTVVASPGFRVRCDSVCWERYRAAVSRLSP